jgi:type IV fimbrial biogenesis protein FimT
MQVRGFTVIEVLVVLTISAILVAMAVPSFQAMIQNNRISSASNSFIATLDIARSEAIRRNWSVTVCRSTNANAPNPTCSNAAAGNYAANDWASGWIVFAVAPLNVPNGQVQANDEVILQQAAFQPGLQQRLIIESTAAAQFKTFDARGLALGGGAASVMFIDHRDIQVAARTNMARCIDMHASGRAHVARVVNDACPAA